MVKRFVKDIRKYFGYSVASAKSQLKAEVANSFLNWVWWILDPLCFMLIYTFIFGYVFSAREQYFPIFIFIGLSMWDFFNRIITGSVKLVKANKPVISKVYLPKYVLEMTKVWINGFKMAISFGIVVLMMVFFRVPVTWNVLFMLPILASLMLLSFGIGCFLMHFGVYVEDLSNVTGIVLRFVFYLTGIFYNVEKRIPEFGAMLNQVNPLAFLITSMRQCMIYGEMPNLGLLAAWFAVSVAVAVLGICKIYKEENSYLKAI